MDYTKKIEVSTGGNKFGDSVEGDENEEDEGVVVGVFETTLTSENMGLNKFEIMIDDEVYNIGSFTLDDFYPYLGKLFDNLLVACTFGILKAYGLTEVRIEIIKGETADDLAQTDCDSDCLILRQ